MEYFLSLRKRMLLVYTIFAMLLFGALGRIFAISVLKHDYYEEKSRSNASQKIILPAIRGRIFSADAKPLALTSLSGSSLYANVRAIPARDRPIVAELIANLLDIDAQKLSQKLEKYHDCAGLPIKFFLNDAQATQVQSLIEAKLLPGIHFRDRTERLYPRGINASHIVGFVNLDGRGVGGIEGAYNTFLQGEAGYQKTQIDALNRGIAQLDDEFKAPQDGADLYLTIDSTIQEFTDQALAELVEDWQPESASALVMESRTGRILAVANFPAYNPSSYFEAEQEALKNRSLTDAWEPGSIFKPLIFASALEQGILEADTPIPYKARIRIRGRVIEDDHPVEKSYHVDRFGNPDPEGGHIPAWVGIMKSSNVTACYVAQSLYAGHAYDSLEFLPDQVLPFEDSGRLAEELARFGYGKYSGIDIGGKRFGESRGSLPRQSEWERIPNAIRNVIPSIAMGYQVQVTAIQMLACFNALATGGIRMRPFALDQIRSADGEVLLQNKSEVMSTSGFSSETAQEMRKILEKVVSSEGTARRAQLKGYKVAGKTGTAMVAENGNYGSGKTCSFVGFAPAQDPVLSIIVTARKPSKHIKNKWGYKLPFYGGTVAAPYFSRIMEKSLEYLGVPKDQDENKDLEKIRE